MNIKELEETIKNLPKREEYLTDGEFAMACERFFKYQLKYKLNVFKKQLEHKRKLTIKIQANGYPVICKSCELSDVELNRIIRLFKVMEDNRIERREM